MNFARFFSNVQDAPWYAHFLNPVLEILATLPTGAKILDVGTGAGKLIELGQEKLDLHWVGADTDEAMLAQARQRPSLQNMPLQHLQPDTPLPFENASFDAVTFCSVLFLLPNPRPLLEEAWRILRPNGRIIVLTPTGSGRISQALLQQIGIYPANWTFFLWRSMTAASGQAWSKKETMKEFSTRHAVNYYFETQFSDLTLVEVVQKGERA